MVGIPNNSVILFHCWITVFPGNKTLFNANSAKMQPNDHISIAAVYDSTSSNSSGARYHNVTTCWVILAWGWPNVRAKPKSEIFK